MLKKGLNLTFLLLFVSLPVFSQATIEELKAEYQKEFRKIMRKENVPGASIVLLNKDSILWEAYFGHADKDAETEVDRNTLFKAGSVTKLFTGAAVMNLKEQGKIELNAPVSDYVPSFNIKQRIAGSPPITARSLLTHQSGLPSDIMRGFVSDSAEPYTSQLTYLNEEYAAFPANYIRAYSNPGYTLLGIMVAEVSGKSYTSYVDDEIFTPLQMNSSTFLENTIVPEALSADFSRKGDYISDAALRDVPAGGLLTHVQDLSKFLSVWLNENSRAVLEPETKKEIWQVQPASPLDFGHTFALGWMLDIKTPVGSIYHHGGATFYHRAMVAVAPEAELAVAILTNAPGGDKLCRLYDDILTKAAEVNGYELKEDEEEEESHAPKKKVHVSNGALKEFAGLYAMPFEAYHVNVNKSYLEMTVQNSKIKLIPVADSIFLPKFMILGPIGIKIKQVRFIFTEVEGEHLLVQEEVKTGKKAIIGQQIELPELSKAWISRVGKYAPINQVPGDYEMFTDFELKEENGKMAFKFKVNFDSNPTLKPALIPVNDSLAYISGLGRQGGQSVRVMENEAGEEILYYSGYKLIKTD